MCCVSAVQGACCPTLRRCSPNVPRSSVRQGSQHSCRVTARVLSARVLEERDRSRILPRLQARGRGPQIWPAQAGLDRSGPCCDTAQRKTGFSHPLHFIKCQEWLSRHGNEKLRLILQAYEGQYIAGHTPRQPPRLQDNATGPRPTPTPSAHPNTLGLPTDTSSFIEILWCCNPQFPLYDNNGVSGPRPFQWGCRGAGQGHNVQLYSSSFLSSPPTTHPTP
ncbi:hypothetical protein P4O66_011096 [Electrophorus voltai]|uniref:Uncharacterized protein n=1 Tax=Electrophorus voltai TaxID=2609070 RepID=A0AAD8ZA41_9TELE|nr:hypothetical protein P4O66_011096 [Electrophorus voltai]